MSDECTYLTRPRLESFILIKSFISPPPSSWPLSQQALMQGLKIKGFPREDESVLSMAKALRVGWADQRPPAACLVSEKGLFDLPKSTPLSLLQVLAGACRFGSIMRLLLCFHLKK